MDKEVVPISCRACGGPGPSLSPLPFDPWPAGVTNIWNELLIHYMTVFILLPRCIFKEDASATFVNSDFDLSYIYVPFAYI